MFIYELSGCGFESSCSHLNFRFRTCFEQGVPWHSGKYKVWIHSETRTWHDKNIQFHQYFRKPDKDACVFTVAFPSIPKKTTNQFREFLRKMLPWNLAPANNLDWKYTAKGLDIQATIECGFTLKRIRNMTRTYNQLFKDLKD